MDCTDTKYPNGIGTIIDEGSVVELLAENDRRGKEIDRLKAESKLKDETLASRAIQIADLGRENERLERAKEELWGANKRLRELADSLRAEGESYLEANSAELKPTQFLSLGMPPGVKVMIEFPPEPKAMP
jgi:hypothetical protein